MADRMRYDFLAQSKAAFLAAGSVSRKRASRRQARYVTSGAFSGEKSASSPTQRRSGVQELLERTLLPQQVLGERS
jgi:hypothetical protein